MTDNESQSLTLPVSCGVAFKEWAAVCGALASGRQTLILRKGGIHEGRAGFRVEHSDFWLLPTKFHQNPGELVPEAAPLLAQCAKDTPTGQVVRLRHFCHVSDVVEIVDEERANELRGLHIWSDETVRQRFHYRNPGLYLLVVRCFSLSKPFELATWPELAGCKSWAPLTSALPTMGLVPVLDDERFRAARDEVLARAARDLPPAA